MNRSTTNIKRILTRAAVLLLVFAIAFTALPIATSSFTVDAYAKKKVAKKITLRAAASGQSVAILSWNKIKKPEKGFAVFRDGVCIAHLGKKTTSFADSGLSAGSYHTYQVKVYKIKKTKKKVNGKKKTVKTYKYSKASNAVGIQTAVAPAAAPAQSGSGTSGTPTGGSTAPTTQRTAYTCTDYLGVTRTIYKDADGSYYLYATGNTKAEPLAKYDKTVDGSWTDATKGYFYQKNSITVHPYTDGADVYNGSADKIKLEIAEDTATFQRGYRNKVAGPNQYKDMNCIMIGEDRLVSYKEYTGYYQSSGFARRMISFWGADSTDSASCYGYDGYLEGDVHITVYYDFDDNGEWADNEIVRTGTNHISKSKRSAKALEIAQAAIAWGDSLQDTSGLSQREKYNYDMNSITGYMRNFYSYSDDNIDGSGLNARCNGGAEVLRVWSAYKYHVYGFVGAAAGGADHVAFYPGKDGVEKGFANNEDIYYEANGKQD